MGLLLITKSPAIANPNTAMTTAPKTASTLAHDLRSGNPIIAPADTPNHIRAQMSGCWLAPVAIFQAIAADAVARIP